jgi:hypothetical protein
MLSAPGLPASPLADELFDRAGTSSREFDFNIVGCDQQACPRGASGLLGLVSEPGFVFRCFRGSLLFFGQSDG